MRSALLLAFVLGGLALVAGLSFVLRPRPQAPFATPLSASPPVASPVTEPPPSAFDTMSFTVQNGRVTGPESFTTTQDRAVVLRVTSDVADEVHLHGYDHAKEVEAGGTVELQFVADTVGRFELELEGQKFTLGFLEVQPK